MRLLFAFLCFGFSFQAFSYPGDISAESVRYPVHVDSNSVKYFSVNVQFALRREITKDIITDETVTVPLCLDTPVDPSQGDWKNYWNETNSNEQVRAQALSVAVRGLDYNSATLIVRHGLFLFRPRFWSEFEQQMRNAESALLQMGSSAHFYETVTVQFGTENAHALGFWADSNCRMSTVTRKVRKTVVAYEPAGILPRSYSLKVVGPILQSFEQDNFMVVLSYQLQDVGIEGRPEFNRYSPLVTGTDSNGVLVSLIAKRNKVDIPDAAISGTLLRTSTGFTGALNIDPQYLAAGESGSSLMLYYELCANWFLGCRTLEETRATVEANTTQTTVHFDLKLEEGQDYRIRYRFYRTLSQYYSADGTELFTNRVAY